MGKKLCFFIVSLSIAMAAGNMPAQTLNPNVQLHAILESQFKPFDLNYRAGVLIGNEFKLKNKGQINLSTGVDFALLKNLSGARTGADFHLRGEYHFDPEKKWDWFALSCITYNHGLKRTTSTYSEGEGHEPTPGHELSRHSLWLQMGCGIQHHWSKHFSGVIEIVLREAIISRENPPITATVFHKTCLNLNFGIRIN